MLTRRQLLNRGVMAGLFGKALVSGGTTAPAEPSGIELRLQSRDSQGAPHVTATRVDPKKVAIIAMDCWHYHWCRTWRHRAGSLIPRFNACFDAARALGMTLIFSPTNATRDLNESPQRKAALALPDLHLPRRLELADPFPGGLRYGMCECGLGEACFYTNNVNNQHPDLAMTADDFMALTTQEAYRVLESKGITHIIYTGFATNMCMWGKPTGMKYMRQFGFRCLFARDLTEAMTGYVEESFNPTRGTLEVIELIERNLAPSIDMEETLRRAGIWQQGAPLDYVHIVPWDRMFGGSAYPIPIQVELTCRHVPQAELRYTLDGSDPTALSQQYRGPIKIDQTARLKAAGFKGNTLATRVSEAQYWKYPVTPDPPTVYISELDPLDEVIGKIQPHSYAVQKAARFKRSVDGGVLSNRDRHFGQGIGVQAPSELVFALKPEYRRFVALVGVDDECMRWDFPDGLQQWPQWSRTIHGPTSYRISQITFEVAFDGKAAVETPPLFNGVLAWGIDIAIPRRAQQIMLRVNDVESRLTDPHGHGDWLDAGFITA